MNPGTDQRTVLTLDAGGTNFVFTAIRGNREIISPLTLPSNGNDLERCIENILKGFREIADQLEEKPSAISFAFPGPTDYETGIVGKLSNLPAFKGGVPLGPILEDEFDLPVFINNDGDLFAYGEALSGFLPEVNRKLAEAGINKRYRNLIGITLGTGFGAGIVRNEELFLGDNSNAAEVWLLRNRLNPETNAEESISIRAIQRVYTREAGIASEDALSPREISEIAMGKSKGNRKASITAFEELGTVLGDALGNILTLIDGAVVIGGGISGAMHLIMPSLLREIQSKYVAYSGNSYPRLVQKVYDLTTEKGTSEFLAWPEKDIIVPGSKREIRYAPDARIPVGVSQAGTSRAVSLGAYAFALKKLDFQNP